MISKSRNKHRERNGRRRPSTRRAYLELLEPRTLLSAAGFQPSAAGDWAETPSRGLAQAAPILYGGPGDQFGTDVEAGGDEVYAVGQQGSQGVLLHLAATDTVPAWEKLLDSGSGLYGLSLSASGIQAVGNARPPTYGARDSMGDTEQKPLLAQLTLDGELVKTSTENFFSYRGGEDYSDSLSVGSGSDEVTYVVGVGEQTGWGGRRTILAKYTADGSLDWKRAYATDAAGNPLAGTGTRIASVGFDLAWLNGSLYVAGFDRDASQVGGSGTHAMLLKYDAAAQPADPQPRADGAAALVPEWSQVLAVESDFRSVIAADGYLYAVGHTFTSHVAGSEDFLLAKYDETGRQIWQTTTGGTGTDVLTAVVAVNGRLFATGYTTSAGAGGEDVVVLEIDPASGTVLSQHLFGGAADDRAENAAAVGNSVYLIGGTRSFTAGGNAAGESDLLLLRYDLIDLRADSFIPTPTGFVAEFNRELDSAELNLYQSQIGGAQGGSDVTLHGVHSGDVPGTLIVDANLRKITFVKTGGGLAPDTYTVTLRSGVTGFKDTEGNLLNGDGAGPAGDDFVQDFTVSAPAAGAVTVSLPDFARGPNQVVNVPASVSTGLPLTLTNDGQVYAIDVQISYDPSLLNITGATVAAGMPAGSTAAINAETPGLAIVGFSSPTPLPAGTVNFVDLQANVPLTAGYGSKQVLDLHQLSINEGAIPALDNDGVQVVAYLGDVTGNGTYSSLDTSRVSRVAVGLDTGFAAFPLADPVLLADITGNGTISSLDTSKVSRLAVGLSVPEVPALPSPSASPLIVGGPDPKLSIPTTLIATPGGSVTVPVNIDSIVDLSASPFFAADLVILFDPAVFSAHSVALGAVPASHPAAGWGLAEANIDNASGRVIIGLANSRGLGGTFEGSLVTIDFTVKPGAPAGPSPINLAASSAPFTTQLNEGGLTLIPAPTNAANDNGVDGVVSVTAHPWQNPKNPLDVNDQGGVTALDALLIISYVNAHETGPLPPTSESPTSYVDVNGDDAVTPLDVLAVVGYLNGQIGSPAGNSEGEASTQPTGTVDASSLPSQTPITVAASEPVFAPALAGSADTMWGTMFPLVPLGVPVESGPSHGVQYLLEDSHLPERLVVHESAAEAQLVNSLTAADHKTTDFRDLVDSVFTELGEAT